jgi:translation initiation factor IF-2
LKVKIVDVAQEVARKPQEVYEACRDFGYDVGSQQGSITTDEAAEIANYFINGIRPEPKKAAKKPAPKPPQKPSEKIAPKTPPKAEKAPPPPIERPKPLKTFGERKPIQKTSSKQDRERAMKPVESAEKPQIAPQKPQTQVVKEPAQTPAIQQPAQPAKEQPQKPVEVKKPDQKPQIAFGKGTGIVIVKKKNQPQYHTHGSEKITSETIKTEYGRRKIAGEIEEEKRDKKKDKKHRGDVKKTDAGKKIEILRDRSLDSGDIFEEGMTIIPSVSPAITDFLADQERNHRAARTNFEKAKTLTGATARSIGGDLISRSKRRRHRPTMRVESKGETIRAIEIAEDVRVYEFAEKINQPIAAVIKKLFELGMMVTKNDFLNKDAIEVLAEDFGVEVRTKDESEEMDYVADYDMRHTDELKTETRPPIVTIMGHVDHGKTSLLDYIRSSRVASGEAGGITQHIGAYTVTKDHKAITFIDTPGHEAFSAMRARGANATDIVIIVVAADDSVMPQTKEAISHAKAAKCPIIVAINKIDKPAANIDRVKGDLAEAGLTPHDWGGDTECVGVSAKSGAGIETLLETILLQAELMELKAERDAYAKAIVIESALERGRGPIATVIVQNGTLEIGDYVVAGRSFGRIRAITGDRGAHAKRLLPSEAGEIVGLDEVPSSGDIMVAMENAEHAKAVAAKRAEYERLRALSRSTKATLDELHDLIAEGRLKRLPIILKADAHGVLEALSASLMKLRNAEVKVEIIHAGVGAISESDVALAAASEHSVILGFHIKPSQIIKDKAKTMGVTIASYDVIYDLIEDVRKILGGMLSPITEERVAGKADVRQVFEIPKLGRIAGCMVQDGEITRGAIARVMRGEDEVYKGRVETLKRFKDDAKEVKKGLECGIGLGLDAIFEPGDQIFVYKSFEIEAIFEEKA